MTVTALIQLGKKDLSFLPLLVGTIKEYTHWATMPEYSMYQTQTNRSLIWVLHKLVGSSKLFPCIGYSCCQRCLISLRCIYIYLVIEMIIVVPWNMYTGEYSQESSRSMDGIGVLEGVIICIGLSVHFANVKCYKNRIFLSTGWRGYLREQKEEQRMEFSVPWRYYIIRCPVSNFYILIPLAQLSRLMHPAIFHMIYVISME